MNVIRHQDVSVKRKAVTLTVVLDAFEVVFPVLVVVKNVLPLIAPSDDVIKGSGKLASRLSRRAIHILRPFRKVQI